MLSALRRNAQSWVIKMLLAVVAVSFVIGFGAFMYVGRYLGRPAAESYIAKVNGVEISYDNYIQRLRGIESQYRQMFGENFDQYRERMNLPRQVLEGMIDDLLLLQMAERMGIEVSDDEVRRQILSYPAFQSNGRFDSERYETVLRRGRQGGGLTPAEFEELQRHNLLLDRVEDYTTGFLRVSEQEVRQEYVLNATKANFRFVELDASDYHEQVELTEEETSTYFNEHRDEFRIAERRQGRVLAVEPEEFLEDIDVADEEIEDYYQANRESRFTVGEQVHARHILRKVDPEAGPEVRQATREFMQRLLDRLQSEETDFAELARQHSEDESAERGGDLGFFGRGRMVGPFEEAAFDLRSGQISDVVETRFGYHIIQVVERREARAKPLEEVRDQVVTVLTNQHASQQAIQTIQTLYASLQPEQSLTELGARLDREVRLTDHVERSEPVEDYDGGRQITGALFGLEEGQISAPVRGIRSWYLVELTGVEPERLPEFNEVAEQVTTRLTSERAVQLARQDAQAIIDRLRANESAEVSNMEALAAERGLQVKETGDLSIRGDSISRVGASRETKEALFRLTYADPVALRPYAVGGKVYVFQLISRQNPSEEGFALAHEETLQHLRRQKQNERRRMLTDSLRESAHILYNVQLLERL